MRHAAPILVLLLCCSPAWAGINFTSASSERYWESGSFTFTYPVSVSAWVYKTSNAKQAVWGISDSTVANRRWYAFVYFTGALGIFEDMANPSFINMITANNLCDANEWHHVVWIFVSAGSRKIYADGALSTNTETEGMVPNLDTVSIGASFSDSAWDSHYDGKLAHLTVWDNYEVTQAEATAMAAGRLPNTVMPTKIRNYYPMWGNGPVGTRLRDMIGTHTLTSVNGTPDKTDSQPIRFPRPQYSDSPRLIRMWSPDYCYLRRKDPHALAA